MAVNAIEMSISDWSEVPDNPRQRDTIKRAKSASRKHLKQYSKLHRVVFAATKNGSILCKLDGHTRSCLWDSGELESPACGKVLVCLFEVANVAEAKALYDQLDSGSAVKKPSDAIFGAARELGFSLNSHLLRSCAFATQLKIATSGKKFSGDIYSMVNDWKFELKELDSLALTSGNTILISLMLVAMRLDGVEKAGEFFTLLDQDKGSKINGSSDGIQLVTSMLKVRRAEGRTAGYDNLMQICGQTWTGYGFWKRGETKKRDLLAIADFNSVVQAMNATKSQHKSLVAK